MVHFHVRSWFPDCQPHTSKLRVTYHLHWLIGLHFKLWIFKPSPPAIWCFSLMILHFYRRKFNFLNARKIISTKFWVTTEEKKEYLMAVGRNKRKREKSRGDPRMQGEHLVCLLDFFFNCPCGCHLMLLLHG